jgi:hypothetical protein
MCLRWSEERLLLISSTLQVLEHQSTDRHDSEHRGPTVVASGTVSWKEATMGEAFLSLRFLNRDCRRFRRLCRRLDSNSLTGTIPSTVGQLSSLQFL